MTTDPFVHDGAAYVLGALSPAQRRAFEEHLSGCEACARSVRDLAGIPGLLAGLGEASFGEPDDVPPVPETLLPQLLREVRRRRRRTRLLAVAGVAAALLLVATLTALVVGGRAEAPPVAAPPAQTMTQVDQDLLTASVSLEPVTWGTRMHLTCRYSGPPPTGGGGSYALVVHTRDGGTQQVATWQAVPGRTLQLDAATDADPADIASVDVVLTGTDRRLLTISPRA